MIKKGKILKYLSVTFLLFYSIYLIGCKTSNFEETLPLIETENISVKSSDEYFRIYDISKDDVEDFKLYISPDGNLNNHLLVIKAKSEEDLEGLKNKVEAAKDKAVKDLGDAGEDVKGRIENSKVYTKGRYLVYSISDDGESIKNSFEEMFNK